MFKPRLASKHDKISRVTTKRMDISYKFQTCKEEKEKKPSPLKKQTKKRKEGKIQEKWTNKIKVQDSTNTSNISITTLNANRLNLLVKKVLIIRLRGEETEFSYKQLMRDIPKA